MVYVFSYKMNVDTFLSGETIYYFYLEPRWSLPLISVQQCISQLSFKALYRS
jgi:hypothetical protein